VCQLLEDTKDSRAPNTKGQAQKADKKNWGLLSKLLITSHSEDSDPKIETNTERFKFKRYLLCIQQ
jgi:hypothetical protein